MPCRDDIPPSVPESHETAQLICYVSAPLSFIPCDWIRKAAESSWGAPGRNDELTEMLCSIIGAMTEQQKSTIMYNGRIREARRLADWWDNHQEVDRQRIARETAKIERGRDILTGVSTADREAILAFLKFQAAATAGS